MNNIVQFFINHWVLATSFIVLLGIILSYESQVASFKESISSEKLVNFVNHENAIVIDIRSQEAFKQGHIAGSKNFAEADIQDNNKKLTKFNNKLVIVVCDNGIPSMKAAKKLKSFSFSNVYTLKGGMRSWVRESLPLVTK